MESLCKSHEYLTCQMVSLDVHGAVVHGMGGVARDQIHHWFYKNTTTSSSKV